MYLEQVELSLHIMAAQRGFPQEALVLGVSRANLDRDPQSRQVSIQPPVPSTRQRGIQFWYE